MAKVTIGTVSEGTLRTEDLLEAFSTELTHLAKQVPQHQQHLALVFEAQTEFEEDTADWDDDTIDKAGYVLDELQDALNEYCPPFVYFGAHPGDGADFGFWPDMDSLMDAYYDAYEHSEADITPTDAVFLPEDNIYVQVSDHGNTTVMDMDRNVLWSVT